MKFFIFFILKILAKRILKKYQPEIIGVTGSFGKSSATEAIHCVLKNKFNTRKSILGYNTELGLPLTVIGCFSGEKSPIKWFLIFAKGLKLIFFRDKNYPKILILEMGANKPGDIEYLIKIASLKIGIITDVGPTHLETFFSLENIIKEKQKIIGQLPCDGWAILNKDNKIVDKMRKKTEAQILTFGFDEESDLRASELMLDYELGDCKSSDLVGYPSCQRTKIKGINFKIKYQGNVVPVFLTDILGEVSAYSVLIAAAVGIIYKINLVEITEALREYKSPPGRMNLIKGIKETLLIDGTYNASPKTVGVSLEILSRLPCIGQKWAVLGDMLELGEVAQSEHKKIGKKIVEGEIDILVTLGKQSKEIAVGAKEKGMLEDKIFSFDNIDEAKKFIQNKMRQGDILLIKGSNGMEMWKIVKEIIAEPLRAEELIILKKV
ncbi:MAG: UDP-N-acetylmuramoyl-tripeptide--D-alanyl-D-alanine ligase [Patescibacteria group bacterium]